MYLLYAVALLFILTMFLSITKLRNMSKETNTLLDKTDQRFDDHSSNVRLEMKAITDDIYEEINSNINLQKKIDSKQNIDIDLNTNNISDVQSNVEYKIEPRLLVFDGNFKSIESLVSDNKSTLDTLQDEISNFNTEQLSWNEQFSNQQSILSSQLDKIQQKDFSEQIANINKKLKDELIPDVKFNKNSITDLSKTIDTNLINDIDDLANKYMTLSSNSKDLTTQTLRLADVVDTHDLFIKSK